MFCFPYHPLGVSCRRSVVPNPDEVHLPSLLTPRHPLPPSSSVALFSTLIIQWHTDTRHQKLKKKPEIVAVGRDMPAAGLELGDFFREEAMRNAVCSPFKDTRTAVADSMHVFRVRFTLYFLQTSDMYVCRREVKGGGPLAYIDPASVARCWYWR